MRNRTFEFGSNPDPNRPLWFELVSARRPGVRLGVPPRHQGLHDPGRRLHPRPPGRSPLSPFPLFPKKNAPPLRSLNWLVSKFEKLMFSFSCFFWLSSFFVLWCVPLICFSIIRTICGWFVLLYGFPSLADVFESTSRNRLMYSDFLPLIRFGGPPEGERDWRLLAFCKGDCAQSRGPQVRDL